MEYFLLFTAMGLRLQIVFFGNCSIKAVPPIGGINADETSTIWQSSPDSLKKQSGMSRLLPKSKNFGPGLVELNIQEGPHL